MLENKLTTVFESMRDIVVMGDNDLVITSMNRPATVFFGWTNDEVRGKSITLLIPSHPMDLPETTATYLARHKNGEEVSIVVQSVRDPHATMIAWTISPLTLAPTFDFTFYANFQASIQQKLCLDDLDCRGRRVFLRVDYNVPIDKVTRKVIDDKRLRATLPTLRKIVADGGIAIIGSHLGRPKKTNRDRLTLRPIAHRLQELLGQEIHFAPDALKAREQVEKLRPGEILLLENLRYHPGEDSKDPRQRMAMAQVLASYCDLYVCDAFGTAHRDTASMTGIPRIMGAGIAGYLMEKEVRFLSRLMRNPPQPVIAIVGGSKVSDKIGLLGNLFNFCQTVIIGGAMAFTFLESEGRTTGKSKVERTARRKGKDIDLHAVARDLMARARNNNVRLVLPSDFACAKQFKNEEPFITTSPDIPGDYMGLDIGPKTISIVQAVIAEARTCIWNGPAGVFELPNFSKGSTAMAKAIANNKQLMSIVGGGETAACVKDYASGITHISTGGGATLELLEGKPLPGLVSLTSRAAPKL